MSSPAQPSDPGPTPPDKPCRWALVIDDEPANRDFLMRLLEQANYEVQGASQGSEALQLAETHEQAGLVVIDNKLPDIDGIELVARMRARYPQARIIMATMLDEPALMRQAFENGCDVFMVKPHGFMELFRRLQISQPGDDRLARLIIDQYGPRPYRG